ncbi:hypothetical protein DY000_02044404 [Brassica cretica]|uniref:protein disulfide-isomerase n=1 Tax=Brassica cretica TaxID=69181 RepID=A0ABQ7EVU4_BRACR|nr:hypothetical protein DY000_02044404 [Brassica cretica]
MNKTRVFTILSLVFAFSFDLSNALYGSSSPVLQLTPSNFKSKVINSNGVVLVEFFAPWCGHCKSLTPTWEKVATTLKGIATVAAIDADAHKSVSQDYGVRGFPTIKVFVPGKPPIDYQGARDAKAISQFAIKQMLLSTGGSGSVNIRRQLLFVSLPQTAASDAASERRVLRLTPIKPADYGVRGFPTIKVFVPGKPPIDYQGARDAKAISQFAIKQIKALLKDRLDGKTTGTNTGGGSSEKKSEPSASVELNSSNFDELVTESKDLWIVEFFAPWCGHCKKLAPEWKKAAKNLKGKVKLGHVDCDADKAIQSRFKVKGFPTILVFGADKSSPLPYEGARSASAIESFALEQLEASAGPVEVTELTGPDAMEEKCGPAAICFVSFLPDILDSKAEGRNKYLEMLLSVAEKFKKDPISFVWVAAGKQPDLEKRVGVGGYGYPAMVALNAKKGAYAPLKSGFEVKHLIEFVKEAQKGGKGNLPIDGTLEIVKTEAWDGKDGEVVDADEFSLEELMADD